MEYDGNTSRRQMRIDMWFLSEGNKDCCESKKGQRAKELLHCLIADQIQHVAIHIKNERLNLTIAEGSSGRGRL